MAHLEDETPLVSGDVKLYKRRWYILLIFSLVAVLQGIKLQMDTKKSGHVIITSDTVWNTWGPIDHTAIIMYGWSDELVALLANYGSILYIVAFIPMVWLLGRSLRLAMLVTSGFMALGTALR